MWVVDTKKEHLAVEEARKLRIPIIGILDTNCDPDEVDYPIPGNDDAIRAVGLLTRVVADAVADGLIARSGAKAGDADESVGAEEPLAEWERELLQGDADSVESAAVEATGGDPAAEQTPAVEATGASSEGTQTPAEPKPAPEAAAPEAAPEAARGRSESLPPRLPPEAAAEAPPRRVPRRTRRRPRRPPRATSRPDALRAHRDTPTHPQTHQQECNRTWRTSPPPTSRSSGTRPVPG